LQDDWLVFGVPDPGTGKLIIRYIIYRLYYDKYLAVYPPMSDVGQAIFECLLGYMGGWGENSCAIESKFSGKF